MAKKHDTFNGEQPERPIPQENPEVSRPDDPREPDVPEEAPQQEPEELPQRPAPAEAPEPDTK